MDDTVYFTENQLYAQFCRSLRQGYRLPLVLGILLAAGAFGVTFLTTGLFPLSVVLGIGAVLGLGLAARRTWSAPPDSVILRTALEKWRQAQRPLDKLLTQPSLHTPPPAWEETDLYDYGVERLLLVERDILVDVFVRNGLHAQERVLVLSVHGYPDYLVPVAQQCLRDNPAVPVYLLHDATTRGVAMARHVNGIDWLPLEGHPVLDLGLFPDDVKRMPNLKAIQPQRQNFAVPVDILLFTTLGPGVAQAMAENLGFSELLRPSGFRALGGSVESDFG